MMKKTTRKNKTSKVLGYSGMATALLAMGADADAQVIYTDVDPDYTFTNEEYEIDFDGDGVTDVLLAQLQYSTVYAGMNLDLAVGYAYAPSMNAVMGITTPLGSVSVMYPSLLQAGSAIGPAGGFHTGTGTLGLVISGDINVSAGDWLGQTGYIGVSFQAGDGEIHYGWVQLALASGASSMTVMGYAYEDTPTTAIAAGDMGAVGIAAVAAGLDFSMAPNPAADRTELNLKGIQGEHMKITVLDGSGKVWMTDETGLHTDTYTLDVSSLAPGVYFVRLENDGKTGYQKIVKI